MVAVEEGVGDSLYEKLSEKRKKGQASGQYPDWFTTGGYQLFQKYLADAAGLKDTYTRISKHLSQYTDDPEKWQELFFRELWAGRLACSTPVLANTGLDRACNVSCSGGYVDDSIDGFYTAAREIALLTKEGFGTSAYLGDIRSRGSAISGGGTADGLMPVLKNIVQVTRDTSQGSTRRGSVACYIPIDSDDFYEAANNLLKEPDDCNVGWNITDAFIDRLESGDNEALMRYQKALKVKMVTGKGYFHFVDRANRLAPKVFREAGMKINNSNLCMEIELPNDAEHTFTCVLSSLNLTRWEEFEENDTIFISTVLLDCVCEDFIQRGKGIKGLEKAVRFTEKSRALGLGALGFHTYLQERMIPFESFQAHQASQAIFKRIREEAERATAWMAKEWGEPEWCKGTGKRNATLMAIAPNTSSALICGGVSQGIEPVVANAYTQSTAGGEMLRINPTFVDVAKRYGMYNKVVIDSIRDNKGSVQHLAWLSKEEKEVFKTAYEISQGAILRLASARQRYIDQGQSINLFFNADESEEYISQIHKQAFLDKWIKGLYYVRTQSGVNVSKDECVACEG